MALSILIDGVERVGALRDKTLTIRAIFDVFAGRADFTLTNILPGPTDTVVISDGARTYLDGAVRGLACDEVKPGLFYCRVTAHDTMTTFVEAMAPFSLSDGTGEAVYVALMAGTGTVSLGWNQAGLFVPYGWWRLGEPSGTTATDEQSAHNGTYVGSPTLGVTGAMTGVSNTAVTFNGTSQYIGGLGNKLVSGQSTYSIAAWAKSSSANATQMIYAERVDPSTTPLTQFYLDANGRPTYRYRSDAGTLNTIVPSSGDWTDGAWHHFAVTKDADAVVIYVDGVSVKTATLSGTAAMTGTMLACIGSENGSAGTYFPGSLDEVMIWRSTIDSVMVRQIYNMRDVRHYASLSTSYVFGAGADTVGATVTTYDYGLAPGQILTLTSDNFNLVALDLAVQEVATRWVRSDTPVFTAELGDAPIHLASAFP